MSSQGTHMERKPKTVINVKSNIIFDFWACQRPLTSTWGSGQVFEKIVELFGNLMLLLARQIIFQMG